MFFDESSEHFLLPVVELRDKTPSHLFQLPFTHDQDLELTAEGPIEVLGPGRCKRFAMHVVNGVIKAVNVSESPDDPVSLCT